MAKRSKQSPRPRIDKVSKSSANAALRDGPPAWSVALLLCVLVGILYGPFLNVPFIFDDVISIEKNESIVSLLPLVGTTRHPGPLNPAKDLPTAGRPLVNLSFALNYRFGGLNPWGYHLLNVLLHIGSATLVWSITRRTLRLPYFENRFANSAGWLALAVALLWALHPIQTEAVIYATQRTELMMAFCYLATLYASLRYWDSNSALWLALATLACFAGMATKEVMVSAPLLVLLFDRTFISGSLANAVRRSWPLYAGLAASLLLLLALNIGSPRSGSAGFAMGVSLYSWWLTQAQVLLMYLKLVVWPAPLLMHYELPYLTTLSESWMYVLPVFLLALTTFVLLCLNRPLGYLGTWMFAILSPTLLVPIITEMAAERRMYLPLAALMILFVVGGYLLASRILDIRGMKHRTSQGYESALVAVAIPTVLLAIAWSVLSVRQLNKYYDEKGLWTEVLHYQPLNHMAHHGIASILHEAGESATAMEHLQEAIRINPNSHLAHYGLAVLYTQLGNKPEAAKHFAEAVRTKPNDMPSRINLAAALYDQGDYDQAIVASRDALEVDPENWAVYNNLGLALQKRGNHDEAIQALRKALELNPQALDLYNDIADTHFLANQPQDALAALEAGLEKARAAGDEKMIEKLTTRINDKR